MVEYEYKNISQVLEDKKYPFTKGQMRAFLMNRTKNGLDVAIRKIGKRLYLRMDLFQEWIESSILSEEK